MNFVYFNPDEMRADVLGCYGHDLVKTPNIDRLAAAGTRFDQCHVQHTVCTPSRCSFMTGWYAHVRGHRTLWHCLRPDEPNTLRYLKQQGYDVIWLGKNDLLSQESFADSVSTVLQPAGHSMAEPVYPESDPRCKNFLYGPREDYCNDWHKVQRAIRYLKDRKHDDPPFMLYLPLTMPHCPYTVPEPWYSMYDPNDLPPLRATVNEASPLHKRMIRKYRDLEHSDGADMRKIMAVYLGMVSYVDHMVGELLNALEETGQYEDTTFFFFSDHGDWAGDYGLVEKWPSGLDDCLTRIPMIVHMPGGKAGHVVNEMTECFDIVPTTLELADIKAQHTHFGRSMIPQLNGAAGDPERAVFAEGGYDLHEPHCFEGRPEDGVCGNPNGIYYSKGLQQQEEPLSVCRAAMIRTATHKLIRRPASGDHELYDLTTDPNEECNLFNSPVAAEVRQELMARMLDWYIQTADVTPFDPDPRGITDQVKCVRAE